MFLQIVFTDKNFLGRGQKLEAIISKREGRNELSQLPAAVKLRWKDSRFGKSTRLSLGFDEDHNINHMYAETSLFDESHVEKYDPNVFSFV